MPSKRRGNNEGSIFKRKSDGLWCTSIIIGQNSDGSYKRKVLYAKTRKGVVSKLQEVQDLLNKGIDIQGAKMTFKEWMDRYLEIYKSKTVREVTYKSYETTCKLYIYPYIGGIPLDELRPDILQRWINDLSQTKHRSDPEAALSARSVNYSRMLVISALEQACRDGLLIRNPAKSTKPIPKDRRKFQALTRSDQEKFIEHLKRSGSDYAPAFLFALMTGLRPTEIAGLLWQNIDLVHRVINVTGSAMSHSGIVYSSPTKTKSGERSIPMTDDLYALLQTQYKKTGDFDLNINNLVFCNAAGKHIDKDNLTRALKVETEKAEVSYTSMRGLRHSFGTRAAEAGINPAVTQQLMGHSSSQITLDYYTEAQTEAKLSALEKIQRHK